MAQRIPSPAFCQTAESATAAGWRRTRMPRRPETAYAMLAGDEVVRAEPFEAIELELTALWGEIGDPPIQPGA